MMVKELEDGEYQTFTKWLGSKIKEKLSKYLLTTYTIVQDNKYLLTFGLSLCTLIMFTVFYQVSHQQKHIPWIWASGGVVILCISKYAFKSLRESYDQDMEKVATKARSVRLAKQSTYIHSQATKRQLAIAKLAKLKAQQRRDRDQQRRDREVLGLGK